MMKRWNTGHGLVTRGAGFIGAGVVAAARLVRLRRARIVVVR